MKKNEMELADTKQTAPSGSCLVSDTILTGGMPVGYMFREKPHHESDSGWRFFASAYDDHQELVPVGNIRAVADLDSSVIPYLDNPIGSEFERVDGTDKFVFIEE